MRRIPRKLFQTLLNVAGRVYVPGHKLEDAMRIAGRLSKKNIACTLGYFYNWQDLSKRENGQQIIDISGAIAASVAKLTPKGYLSIKAPAFNYDPAVLASIIAIAGEQGVLAHFDSHGPGTADATLDCVKQAVTLGAAVGLTIPGRWRRSPADAELACRLGLRVRVVKGEWADPQEPGMDLRAGFLSIVDSLAGQAREVAIATHDPWLARESIMRLQAAGTACELELLNGLPSGRLLAIAKDFAVPVRVYIPFGISWRPYALSKVGENPRILWWMIRDSLIGLVSTLRNKLRR